MIGLVQTRDGKIQQRVDKLDVAGKIGTMRTGETAFVPLPVDDLSWTQDVKAAVQGGKFCAHIAWLAGALSPLAREGLNDAGWTVREFAPRG